MHIPDGYLGPITYGGLWAAVAPVWYTAAKRVKTTLKAAQVPLLALSSAFSFVIMMFNVPIPGGTTGHATGATLVAILLGPWSAVIAISITIVVQAFIFGDGGITAIGANCFNMAFADVIMGYGIYKLIRGSSPTTSKRTVISGAIGAYAGITIGAFLTGVELGIQPYLYKGPDGRPLYSPFPLSIAVPAMVIEYAVVFGIIEAVITALVLIYLQRSNPELIRG